MSDDFDILTTGDVMLVLLSPAKTMKHKEYHGKTRDPLFSDMTQSIVREFQKLSLPEIREWYQISDKIAQQTWINWQNFYYQTLTIALYAYQGEAYRNLDATSMTASLIKKSDRHLRILSACYGLLRPLDKIAMYRLDFTKNFPHIGNGIRFWETTVTDALIEEISMHSSKFIVNCASDEYSRMIDLDRIKKSAKWIDVEFVYIQDNKPVSIAMHAKAARGTLAQALIENPITSIRRMNRYLPDYSCEIDSHTSKVTYTKIL